MGQYQEFISNHWLLASVFIAVLVLLILNEIRMRVFGTKRLSSDQFVQTMNHEQCVVVDLRPEADFNKGHILNAVNVQYRDFEKNLNKLEKHKDKTLLLVCNMGQQSPTAGALLSKHGFEKVACLAGGIMAWRSDNLPLTTD